MTKEERRGKIASERRDRRSRGGRTVHGDKARDDSDSKASENPPDHESGIHRRKLDPNSNAEEGTGSNETPFSTEKITNRSYREGGRQARVHNERPRRKSRRKWRDEEEVR